MLLLSIGQLTFDYYRPNTKKKRYANLGIFYYVLSIRGILYPTVPVSISLTTANESLI